ncbi:MAG: DUF2948 family protein [Alphaproteobacteria bacterium]
MTKADCLRLKAKDAEDMQIISAILQDAIVPVCDIAYEAAERRFVMAVSRFRWERTEAGQDGKPVYERINCAVTVEGVTGVKCQKIDLAAKSVIHELLALILEGQAMLLVFAGGACLRLELGDWSARLEDFGAPWPTSNCPRHDPSTDAA